MLNITREEKELHSSVRQSIRQIMSTSRHTFPDKYRKLTLFVEYTWEHCSICFMTGTCGRLRLHWWTPTDHVSLIYYAHTEIISENAMEINLFLASVYRTDVYWWTCVREFVHSTTKVPCQYMNFMHEEINSFSYKYIAPDISKNTAPCHPRGQLGRKP
jgi:hypothetical protein